MQIRNVQLRELAVPDAFLVEPQGHHDERGVFYEWFRRDVISEAIGRPFTVEQCNLSVSHRGTLRGLHGTRGPASQAKLVTCLRGAVLDIVVDLRVGSPTFGRHTAVRLTADSTSSLFISEGMAHAFLALEDRTSVHYSCSMPYVADAVYRVDPLDPRLALPWELTGTPILSEDDRKAPSVADALADGLLPDYAEWPPPTWQART